MSPEPIEHLTVDLPEKEYQFLEEYCLECQETKHQVIRSLIRSLQTQVERG